MATENQIIREVERMVGDDPFSSWSVGVTDTPRERKYELGSPEGWKSFNAYDNTCARNVENYFINKGMKPIETDIEHADYVYVYKG